ncbi:TPA: hypothetical protein NG573_004611 [Vibrio parahaemolyticus]|nr:hypothetical protein [Vibrio parahaemolyticus]HCG8217543.1 hypothetical protein [Vibrio parahaemolyticus]HCM0851933.1 hypothetical protein [Vibrio parahaemolyticus]
MSAVDELGDLVHSVKKEVKDFISENWDEFLEKLTGIDVPEYLLEQYPDFYQYLEWVLQLVGLM